MRTAIALTALLALAACGVDGPPERPAVTPDEESIFDEDARNVVGMQVDSGGNVRFGGRVTIGANFR